MNKISTYENVLSKNKRLSTFIAKSCTDPSCENLDLLSLLIMPVQRIPRYVLLLKALIDHTHKDDPDMNNLQSAYKKMMDVADEINTKKTRSRKPSTNAPCSEQFGHGPPSFTLCCTFTEICA